MSRPYEFNDSPEERRHKRIGFCIGLAGFLIVLAMVGTFLYELAKAVKP